MFEILKTKGLKTHFLNSFSPLNELLNNIKATFP